VVTHSSKKKGASGNVKPQNPALLDEIEKLSPEQQERIAEALSTEPADARTPQPTLAELMKELDEDIAHGDIDDLETLENLP
jgi:hypothetical protein